MRLSNHPLNLLLRFLLELFGLAGYVYWGFTNYDGIVEWLLGIGVPVLAAAVWGIFRVPNDGGAPLVQVSGIVRLLIEAVFFGGAILAFYAANQPTAALLLAVLNVVNYLISWDRVMRLINNENGTQT